MTTTTIMDRVRAGTIYLDEMQPGWRDRVSINDLEMADTCKCVLGQIFEAPARNVGAINLDGQGMGFWYMVKPSYERWETIDLRPPLLDSQVLTSEEAVELGFDVTDDGNEDYPELANLWRQVIKGVPANELVR